MTTLNNQDLLEELKDKESRHIFAAEHIREALPFQIHSLREARGLTQTALARKAKMAQERISVLEDPNYGFLPKIQTLLRLAEVFDVPLIVRFGTWSELLKWETNLSPETLAPPTFEEDTSILSEVQVPDINTPNTTATVRKYIMTESSSPHHLFTLAGVSMPFNAVAWSGSLNISNIQIDDTRLSKEWYEQYFVDDNQEIRPILSQDSEDSTARMYQIS